MPNTYFAYDFAEKKQIQIGARWEDITFEQARTKSKDLLTKAERARNELKKIIAGREETIWNRWQKWGKKNPGKRTKVLFTAWPDIPKSHRPDLKAMFEKKTFKAQKMDEQAWNAILAPHINLEDLSQSDYLPTFILSRSSHSLEEFVVMDYEAAYTSFTTRARPVGRLFSHWMLIPGPSQRGGYGHLIEDAARIAYHAVGHYCIDVGQGILVLEAQLKTLEFLCSCTRAILHDLDLTVPSQDSPKTLKDLQAPSKVEQTDHSLAYLAVKAPYCRPNTIEMPYLESLLNGRFEIARDHIWALREDPGYFETSLRDASEFRSAGTMVKYKLQKNFHIGGEIKWDMVLLHLVDQAYIDLIRWYDVARAASKVSKLKKDYDKHPTIHLPEDFQTAVLYLKESLELLADLCLRHIVQAVMLQDDGVREVTFEQVPVKGEPDADNIHASLHHPSPEDPLTYCLTAQKVFHEHPWQAAQIASDCFERTRDDANKILRQMTLGYHSWFHLVNTTIYDRKKEIQGSQNRRVRPSLDAIDDLTEWQLDKQEFEEFAKLPNPNDGRFHYPMEKKRNLSVTNTMRAAEQSLDILWRELDEKCKRRGGKTLNQALCHAIGEEKAIIRTAEWQSPERDLPLRSINSGAIDTSSAFQERGADNQNVVTPRRDLPHPRPQKQKTKGEVQQDELNEEGTLEVEATEKPGNIYVKKDAYDVFSFLFHDPTKSDRPREIPWTRFIQAFTSIGFSAQKIWGSAWHLSPGVDAGVNRSIQFHEPHPVDKINYQIGRRIGRRLNRVYGWTGDQFILDT